MRCAKTPLRLVPAGLLGLLAGCASLSSQDEVLRPLPIAASASHLADAVPADKLTTATRQLALEGIKALDARDYEKASRLFNLALKTEINNSALHFLNALAYHLRAMAGEGGLYALAQQGYELSIQFDGSNHVARHYLGLLLLDRREFASARDQLMQAALYSPRDTDLLYDLAVAAYYARDARTAYAAIRGLRELQGGQPDERTLRAGSIVAAAVGDMPTARDYLSQLRGLNIPVPEQHFLESRVASWEGSHRAQVVPLVPVQFPGAPGAAGFPGSGIPAIPVPAIPVPTTPPPGIAGFSGATSFFDKSMVNLEVVIIATEEDNNDTFGVNLLEGLRLQFGDSLGTPGYRWSESSSRLNDTQANITRDITRVIQVPGVTYSLNIANATDRRSEVLARPSLVAMGGQTSTFFSGVDVIGAAVSTGQGGSVQVQKEAGVKLAVTPEFLPDNLIKLQVVAERTFLTNPNSNVLFDFRLDTSKTLVSANVAMKFGETLILSGLSERNLEGNNNGVPGLRDVPLVQYLFSRKTERDFHKSVLIMITPRRPSHTNRSAEDVAAERASMSELERMHAEFEDRFQNWFKPVPANAAVMAQLEETRIVREFRSGDLKLESWTSRASHGGRLRTALKFLYY